MIDTICIINYSIFIDFIVFSLSNFRVMFLNFSYQPLLNATFVHLSRPNSILYRQ